MYIYLILRDHDPVPNIYGWNPSFSVLILLWTRRFLLKKKPPGTLGIPDTHGACPTATAVLQMYPAIGSLHLLIVHIPSYIYFWHRLSMMSPQEATY